MKIKGIYTPVVTPFKKNKLIRKQSIDWDKMKKINNYGMKIKKRKDGQK